MILLKACNNTLSFIKKNTSFVILIILLPFFLLFQNAAPSNAWNNLPHPPLVNTDTIVVKKQNGLLQPTAPHIPLHDYTHDGRVASLHRLRNGSTPLFVVKPEKVNQYIIHDSNSKVGANLIDYNAADPSSNYYLFDTKHFRNAFPKILGNINFSLERTILCEKTESRLNPYACGHNLEKDCYEVTLIGRFGNPDESEVYLASVDVRIDIEKPKTQNAKISHVEIFEHTYRIGPMLPLAKMAEPVVVGDGRLFVARTHDSITLTTNGNRVPRTNIIYSTYPARDINGFPTMQCDVTKWRYSSDDPNENSIHPIAHAHYDKRNLMKNRYKFARFPFRDGLGNIINGSGAHPDGNIDIGGSYPWMDRDAANLFFTAFGGDKEFYNFTSSGNIVRPFYEKKSGENGYFTPNKSSEHSSVEIKNSRTMGISVLGFWTHGKAVLLDGLINNVDFNFRIAGRAIDNGAINVHRQLELYKSNSQSNRHYEVIGAGRERGNDVNRDIYHPFLSLNSTYLGSIENRLNYVETMIPVTPRDVVWHFGSSRYSEEIVFDEYMTPFNLIYSDMTAAIGAVSSTSKSMTYYDGIEAGNPIRATFNNFPAVPPTNSLLFQNSSTAQSDFIKVPQYGKPIGNVRVEPIAKGGIYGKGVWLKPDSGIEYRIPNQTTTYHPLTGHPWYVGTFLDVRESYATTATAVEKRLFSLSSGAAVLLGRASTSGNTIAYDRVVLKDLIRGRFLGVFWLNDTLKLRNSKWYHIGLEFFPARLPELYINGFRVGKITKATGVMDSELYNFFTPSSNSSVYLGSNTSIANNGIQGWFDEFRMVARSPSLEEKCNYARGTLTQVNDHSNWLNVANAYSDESHQMVTAVTGRTNKKFVCYVRYGHVSYSMTKQDSHAHLKNIPMGLESVREQALIRSRVLKFNEPRPDYSRNNFCLSCHVPQYASGTTLSQEELDTRALERRDNFTAQNDLRRQPQQPPRWIRGVIPANYFGIGKPSVTLKSANARYEVDQWILQSSGLTNTETADVCERKNLNWGGHNWENACGCMATHGYFKKNEFGSKGQACQGTLVAYGERNACERTTFIYQNVKYDMQCGCGTSLNGYRASPSETSKQGITCYKKALGAAPSTCYLQDFERDGYKYELACGCEQLGPGFTPSPHKRNGYGCYQRIKKTNRSAY